MSIDQAQLRELLGEAELRDLLDADAIADVETELQQLHDDRRARTVDGVHDMLLRLGDLAIEEIDARAQVDGRRAADELVRARRAIAVSLSGQSRIIPVEYASRYRDALGVPLPPGLPEALLEPAPNAAQDLARRYARTHAPVHDRGVCRAVRPRTIDGRGLLKELAAGGRLIEGEFRPGGTGREWCDPDVLQTIRRRSLAKLRHQVEPVEPAVLGRLVTHWQGVVRRRAGLDALLDAIEGLQGAPLIASILETEILPARVEGYQPSDLDALTTAGEVVWGGLEPLGEHDGRLALYLDRPRREASTTARAGGASRSRSARSSSISSATARRSSRRCTRPPAADIPAIRSTRSGPSCGPALITNDSLNAVRAFTRPPERRGRKDTLTRRREAAERRGPLEPSAAGGWRRRPPKAAGR